MSAKLTCLISIVLLLIAFSNISYAQVENMVLNPSFEEDEIILDDLDGEQWWTWGTESGLGTFLEIDESRFIDGTRSLRVEPTGTVNWYFVLVYSPLALEVGEEYTCSFWATAEEPRPLTAQLKATDNTSNWGTTEYELTTEWAEYSFTAAALNAEGKFEFWCSSNDTTFWLDYVYTYKGGYVAGIKPGGVFKTTVPKPADGAVDVLRDITLSWTSGKAAATHDIYLGTNPDEVNNAYVTDTTGIYRGSLDIDVTSYIPAETPLEWGQTYYWRVDEVNDIEPNSPWKGDIWSFTTTNHIVVDDFENYTDFPPNEVWNAWIDGFGDPTNGSTAGYPDPDFNIGEHYVETTIVHSGDQSMPLFYDNSAGLSEVIKAINDDWTRDDVITLTLFYYGSLSNDPESMYIALNDTVITNDNPSAAQVSDWTRWDILLQDFGDIGVDLSNIDTMSIGFGNKANPVAGGSGRVFIDDIRLYRSAPVEQEPELEPVDPGTDNLVVSYSFENNLQDSSGHGLTGTMRGSPLYVDGISGKALWFDGANDYIDCGNNVLFDITEQITLSAWVNTDDTGGNQHNPYVGKGDHAYAIKHSNTNQIQFFIYDGGWFTANYSVNDSFNEEWHHVAGTYDGNELKTYVDGILRATTAHVGTIETQPHNLTIATNSEEEGRFYEGAIDEARIYNRALSANEILYLVNER